MKETLISFETAKLAKEKRFDWLCNGFYDLYNNPHNNEITYSSPDNWNLYKSLSAPTQSLLQKWLREVHKIDVYVISEDNNTYWYNLHGENIDPKDFKLEHEEEDSYDEAYEEALEIGLQEGLKLVTSTTKKGEE